MVTNYAIYPSTIRVENPLLRAVQMLPVDEQTQLTKGKKIEVVSLRPDGKMSVEQVDAGALTGEQIKLVFDAGRMRRTDEQKNMILSASTARKREKAPAARQYKIKISADRKVIRIGRMSISTHDLLTELRAAGVLDKD